MEPFCSHYNDFHENWYLNIFRKYVKKIQVSLKSDKNNGYVTWRPIYVFDHPLILLQMNKAGNERINTDVRSCNLCCSRKAISITHSEICVCGFVNCAHAIFSSVAFPGLPYFPTFSHKGHNLKKKKIEPKMCIFCTNFVYNIVILRRTE